MLNIYSMTGRLGFISGNRTQMKNIFKALAIVLFMATAIIPATAKKTDSYRERTSQNRETG
jgi:hypothetical protein